MTSPLSPCYSDCDSVSGLLDRENNLTGKPTRRDIFSQMVQTFRPFSRSRQYRTLGSCPNLAQLTSKTLVLKDCASLRDKMLNINTPYGRVKIFKTGNPQGPSLVTLHDLGLNGFSNFCNFWGSPGCAGILAKFCVLNLTLPGQESGATSLPAHYSYPGPEELVCLVEVVLDQLQVNHCVLMGVGLGGYLALSLAVKCPALVDGLVLVNTSSSSSGWLEWAYSKVNIVSMRRTNSLPDSVLEFLLWHHLGNTSKERGGKEDCLVPLYRHYFASEVNPANLSLLLQSYASRREISLHRKTVKMPVLNLVGDRCPHLDATISFNMKTDPAKTTWMKITNAGMVLEEQPDKVAEALGLFLQGLGHNVKIGRSRSAPTRPSRLDIKGNTARPPPHILRSFLLIIDKNILLQ